MAEPFNPEAFRQHMAQGQPPNPAIPSPVPAPAPVPSPMPAVAAPQPMAPAQHGHMPGQAQPYVPQAPQPQSQHQPQQMPHPHNQQQYAPQQAPQPNPAYRQSQQAHPQQANFQPPFQQAPPAMQQGYAPQQQFQTHNPMPAEAVQEPVAKRSLFKRKKLKEAATQMAAPQKLIQEGEKTGLSRLIVFASGLALGVFGTMISIMLFSGNEPQRATVANGQLSPASQTVIQGSSQVALTDEMLLEKARQGGTP